MTLGGLIKQMGYVIIMTDYEKIKYTVIFWTFTKGNFFKAS